MEDDPPDLKQTISGWCLPNVIELIDVFVLKRHEEAGMRVPNEFLGRAGRTTRALRDAKPEPQ